MKIAVSTVDFLGAVVGEGTIKLQPHIIKKTVNFNEEELKTKKGLRSFLGILNYAQNHILKLEILLRPLYEKTNAHGDKRLKPSDYKLVRKIKEQVQNLPDLEIPPENAYIILETDGCMEGWGGIVKWKKSKGDPRNSEKICAYASGKFSTTQSTIDAEINACINTLEKLKIYYLDKQEVTLRTDWKQCGTLDPTPSGLVQNGCPFYGLRSEDPDQHLKDFLKLMDSLDLDGANKERTSLRESLLEAWTGFKDLLQKVPHHGIDLWLQIHFFYDHVNPVTRRTIDQLAGVGTTNDFAKPFKAISLSQDVPSTSDRRLIELENQVQSLMEAHLAPMQSTQVNKITTLFLSACSYPTEDPQCSTHIHGLINTITIHPKKQSDSHDDKPTESKEEEKDSLKIPIPTLPHH
ncbi:putative polyprotein [Tanacetum coccineum]